MSTDIELERRLRRAAARADRITAEAVIARAVQRRRRHRLLAGGLAAAVALIAGVVTAATISNGATSVSVATGPTASRVPPITNTSKITIHLTPSRAAPGTVIDATLTAERSLAQISAADYLVVQAWTNAGWKSLYFAFLTRSQQHPTDLRYSPHQWLAGVGLGTGTYRLKIPAALPAGTYRLELSASALAAGAQRFHPTTAYTRLEVTGAATCPPLPQRIVTDVNHLGTDKHLGPPQGSSTLTCAQAIRADKHPTGTLPVIGVRLMTLTSVQYPHGRLVWIIATTPGPAVRLGGAPAPSSSTSTTTPPTTPPRYGFSIDIIDARTGTWLQSLEGS